MMTLLCHIDYVYYAEKTFNFHVEIHFGKRKKKIEKMRAREVHEKKIGKEKRKIRTIFTGIH